MTLLVATGVAACETGISARTLQHWVTRRLVTPALVLPSGHLRWDLDDLHRQLTALGEQPAGPAR